MNKTKEKKEWAIFKGITGGYYATEYNKEDTYVDTVVQTGFSGYGGYNSAKKVAEKMNEIYNQTEKSDIR